MMFSLLVKKDLAVYISRKKTVKRGSFQLVSLVELRILIPQLCNMIQVNSATHEN